MMSRSCGDLLEGAVARERLDKLLVDRGLAPSRERAAALVMSGNVLVNGHAAGKPGNQKLIDMLAELKLIRSLQVQVNNRTKMYGDKDKGEQSKDDLVQKELRQLSIRQTKLQEMVDKLDKGENEK